MYSFAYIGIPGRSYCTDSKKKKSTTAKKDFAADLSVDNHINEIVKKANKLTGMSCNLHLQISGEDTFTEVAINAFNVPALTAPVSNLSHILIILSVKKKFGW